MFNKYEIIGGIISVIGMVVVLYLLQGGTDSVSLNGSSQMANSAQSDIIRVGNGDNIIQERTNALLEAVDGNGNVSRMVIDDIKVGEGAEVQTGDTVTVHYIGSLPDGTEFDNSRKRGQTFRFTVGAGQVIAGWEEGLVGMKVGGQRILIVPSDKAYGPDGFGPIPGGATLVFAIDLITIE